MSLINQMLRDLEERRADELNRQNLQREIRALPPAKTASSLPRVMLGLVILGAVAVGGWQAYEYWMPSIYEQPAVPVAPVAVATPPAPPMPPPVQLPTDAMMPREIEAPAGADGLRMTLDLQNVPPEGVTATAPLVAANDVPAGKPPATPAPEIAKAGPATQAAAPQPSAKVVPKVATEGPATIEKSASLTAPRERAEAEYRRAQAAAAGGKASEVIESLQAALRQDPNHVPARQGLIRTLLETRRGDEAEAVLREGLELQPAQIGWAMTLARLQVERNDLPAALKTLGRSAPHGARSADYQGFFGHIEYRLGHGQEAVALYQAATRLAPGEGRWWLGLGLALEADGHAGEAREAFRKALGTGNLNADLAAIAEQKGR